MPQAEGGLPPASTGAPPSFLRPLRRSFRHSCAGRNPCDRATLEPAPGRGLSASISPPRQPRATGAPPSFLRPSVVPAPPPSFLRGRNPCDRATPIEPLPPSLPPRGGDAAGRGGPPASLVRPAPLRHSCAPPPSFLRPLRHSCAGRNPCDRATLRRAGAGSRGLSASISPPAGGRCRRQRGASRQPRATGAPPSFLRPPPSFLRRQESMPAQSLRGGDALPLHSCLRRNDGTSSSRASANI